MLSSVKKYNPLPQNGSSRNLIEFSHTSHNPQNKALIVSDRSLSRERAEESIFFITANENTIFFPINQARKLEEIKLRKKRAGPPKQKEANIIHTTNNGRDRELHSPTGTSFVVEGSWSNVGSCTLNAVLLLNAK